jgi:acyl transferase domain-containing protein
VSSFGFGGTNTHAIVQEDDNARRPEDAPAPVVFQRQAFPLCKVPTLPFLQQSLYDPLCAEVGYHLDIGQRVQRLVADHRLNGRVLFLASGLLEMMVAVAQRQQLQKRQSRAVSLADLSIRSPLVVAEGGEERTAMRCVLLDGQVSISSLDGEHSTVHAEAIVSRHGRLERVL